LSKIISLFKLILLNRNKQLKKSLKTGVFCKLENGLSLLGRNEDDNSLDAAYFRVDAVHDLEKEMGSSLLKDGSRKRNYPGRD